MNTKQSPTDLGLSLGEGGWEGGPGRGVLVNCLVCFQPILILNPNNSLLILLQISLLFMFNCPQGMVYFRIEKEVLLPRVPQIFLSRSPVSVMSVLVTRAKNLWCRRQFLC